MVFIKLITFDSVPTRTPELESRPVCVIATGRHKNLRKKIFVYLNEVNYVSWMQL